MMSVTIQVRAADGNNWQWMSQVPKTSAMPEIEAKARELSGIRELRFGSLPM
jgi:hypothetical protein